VAWVVLVVGVVAAATAFSLRPEVAATWTMWLGLLVPYAALSLLAFMRPASGDILRERMRFRGGDPSLGILLGLLVLAAAWPVSNALAPAGTAQRAWLFQVFLIAGDLKTVPAKLALIAIVVLEEIVWRGWVLAELEPKLGVRYAWLGSAALYALVHVPSVFTLSDASAGPNPLLPIAAFCLALPCGALAARTGRLIPGMFCHIVFSYFGATSFQYFM
jgi:membrane protease YdiL (CAAX protease family)